MRIIVLNIGINTITAVIVTYNPEISIVVNLVRSLESQKSKVIIVDNGSSNCKEIESSLSDSLALTFIDLKENVGLAKAQNIGIQKSFHESDYFIIFDQDSEIPDDFVSQQYACYKSLADIYQVGAVGPTFTDKDSGYQYPATVYKGPFIKKVDIGKEPVEATFIIASGSFIPKKVFEEVGMMLDDFFIDFVDVEWCMRANYLGYHVFINPNLVMKHSIGDMRVSILGRYISLHSDFRKFYIYRNGVFMMRLKYIPFWYKVRLVVFNLIRTMLGIIFSDKKKGTIKVSMSGWKSGFGNFNKNASGKYRV